MIGKNEAFQFADHSPFIRGRKTLFHFLFSHLCFSNTFGQRWKLYKIMLPKGFHFFSCLAIVTGSMLGHAHLSLQGFHEKSLIEMYSYLDCKFKSLNAIYFYWLIILRQDIFLRMFTFKRM